MCDATTAGLIQDPEASSSQVQQFFSGRSVLVTGATGFCGKVLLEKLLRSCPGLECVYVVVRPRRGQDAPDRVATLLNQPLFASLGPEELGKVVPVAGDLSGAGLGLSLHDKEMLCQRVSVVFHLAASVRFDDELRTAMETNVWATEAIVKLAKSMDHLKALVYVSTAYSNCLQDVIEEKVYEPLTNTEELCKRLATMTSAELAPTEAMILRKWPNTYAFTKALGECVVQENCEALPVAIFRPSIVTCTWKEPVAGWIDTINGPTVSIMGGALGKIRCGVVEVNNLTDMVPVDMVANGLIATAWDIASNRNQKSPRVYNFVSGPRNPLTWGRYLQYTLDFNWEYPSTKAAWYCKPIFTPYKKIYFLLSLVLELLPILLLDLLPYLRTGKHRNLDMYLKSGRYMRLVTFFTTHQWKFHDANVVALLGKMSPEDKAVFQMDVADINWRDYTCFYVQGVRQHLLKESPSTVPEARKRYFRLFLLHHAVVLSLYALLGACVVYFLRRWA